MKRFSTILFIIAVISILAGIWSPPLFVQCAATALVLALTAAVLASQAEAKRKEAVKRAAADLDNHPRTVASSTAGAFDRTEYTPGMGLRFNQTPDRSTMTQAQIDAEIRRITSGQDGHQ
jgi:Tfp pilus assembly protein FimT